MKKILVVCGNGLGSSFIMELNVKKALVNLGKEAEVSHTDLATSKTMDADFYIGAPEIMERLEDGKRKVIPVKNILKVEEIESALKDIL